MAARRLVVVVVAVCVAGCAASHAPSRKTECGPRARRIARSRSAPVAALADEEEVGARRIARSRTAPVAALADEEEVDVVIIGAGVGGLSCGAMAARYGLSVLVLESHSIAGGCAHGFERGGFLFDSGPSLFNGMGKPSTNPLRQVLDACGEDVEWLGYDGWEMILPQGRFYFRCGDAASWEQTLTRFGGPNVLREWRALSDFVAPITAAAAAIPPLCLRDDPGALVTIALHGLKGFLSAAPVAKLLTAPFSTTLERAAVTDPFLLAWFDYLAFALSGLDASQTLGAAVAYTMGDLYPAGCALDYPVGGSAAVVDALVRAIRARGGRVQTSAHVEAIEVDERGRAAGVALRGGKRVRARRAVVSNAHVGATVALLPERLRPAPRAGSGGALNSALEMTPSFMHLHLGVRAAGMAEAAAAAGGPLRIHYSVVLDDFSDILAERNMVIVSIPTVLDPSLAPEGHHLIHAYYAADEPYAPWVGLDRRSPEYAALKDARGANLWRALELIVPDVRSRVVEELVASPLTHERFNRRPGGTYGPTMFPKDGSDVPWARTQVPGLLHCGDSCYPGIGLPAVAASGASAASTIVSLGDHLRLLADMRRDGTLRP